MTDPTITPPPLDLAALRKFAIAATPGPWGAADEHRDMPDATPAWCLNKLDADGKWLGDIAYYPQTRDANEKPDALYAAAFDPPTVLALIARVEQIDGDRDQWRSEIGRLTRERDEWESNATEESARAEAAEAKIAAVRDVLEHHTFVADDKYGDLAASQYYGDSELEAVAAKSITRALDGAA